MTTLHDLYRNAWQEISFGFNDMLGRHEPDETIVSVLDAVIDKWGALIDHKLKQHHRPPSGKAHLRSLTSNEERRRIDAERTARYAQAREEWGDQST